MRDFIPTTRPRALHEAASARASTRLGPDEPPESSATSQAIGSLLRNHLYALYAGIVHVPEYGVRVKRGDFEPLISEDLFYRVQSVLSGRVPITTPQQRAHPDFHCAPSCAASPVGVLTAIVRTVSSSSEMTHCERHTRTRLQIALKRYRTALIGELHDDIDDPWPARGRVWALSGIVCVETGAPIAGYAGVVAGSIRNATEHGHRAFRICHGSHACNADSNGVPSDFPNLESSRSINGDSCLPRNGKSGKFCSGPTFALRATVGILRESAYLSSLCMEFLRPNPERRLACHPKLALRSVTSEGWWTRPGSNR